jgi:hypothetical protein
MNKEASGVVLVLITAVAGGFWFYQNFDIFLTSEDENIGSEVVESLTGLNEEDYSIELELDDLENLDF